MDGTATPTRFEGACTEADAASCESLAKALNAKKGPSPKNHIEVRLRVKPYGRAYMFIRHDHPHPHTPLSMLVVEAPIGTDPIWVKAQAVKWIKEGAPDLARVAPAPKAPPREAATE
jgi:hypothetical protein